MARGFESKQVESQQQDREARHSNEQELVGDPAADAARRTLQLALMRARDDMTKARSAAHRAMLEQAIAALTAQLEQS